MRKFILFFFFSALLASCTSTKNYESMLNTWIGKSEKDVIMAWGIPERQYQIDANTKLISYNANNTVVYPGTVSTCFGSAGNNSFFGSCSGFPPSIETFHCETLFTLVNGRVTRWGHRGNDCQS